PAEVDHALAVLAGAAPGEVHQPGCEVLHHAAEGLDLRDRLPQLDAEPVEALREGLPCGPIDLGRHAFPTRLRLARRLLAAARLQGHRLAVALHRGLEQRGQARDQAVDLVGGEQAVAHGASTKTACTSLGPCTPRVRVSSMSAVREGPVMKLIIAPRSGGGTPSCHASSASPTCSSDSTSASRSKTAT